jgi:regulator of protease activity HflC (stomatin/prohibitin superfamily)
VSTPLIVAVAVVVLSAAVAAAGLVIVPPGHAYVTERLGRYDQTLTAGMHVLVPFVDSVRFKHSLGEQTIAVPNEACRTRDEGRVWIDGAVTLRIADARLASYEVADYRAAAAGLARTALRRCIAAVDLDRLHADRLATGRAIVEDMQAAANAWGLTVLRYDLIDIRRHNKESAA